MAIKGSLKEASLADVCQLLALGQKTGCLSVTDRARFGQIFFDAGRITFARIINRRDRLGDLLIRDGLLDHPRLQDILGEQARQPDRRLGEFLIERGLITREQLEHYIRLQIEEALYYLFTWSHGSFYFEVDQSPEETDFLVSINPESVLLEGARRVDEWSLIEKKIPSLDLIFTVDRAHLTSSAVDLTPEQERILPLLDGTMTVQQIIDQTGLGEFEAGQALFGLVQAGFAHRVGRRTAEKATRAREAAVLEHTNLGIAFYRTSMYRDAAREFAQVLELHPEDATARFHLALLALREGRLRESMRQFKALLEQRGPSYAVFMNLAFALRRLRRPGDALLVLGEADALRPGTPQVALERAMILLETGDVPAGRAALDDYLARLGSQQKPSAMYYYHAALGAAMTGHPDTAGTLLRAGLEAHRHSAPLLLLGGALAERQTELAAAERYYRRAAEEDALLPQVHKCLGDVSYRRGLHDEALEHFRRAVELAPDLGDDVYAKLGNLHYKRQERDDALRCWRRALELNPANQVVRNNVEVVARVAG